MYTYLDRCYINLNTGDNEAGAAAANGIVLGPGTASGTGTAIGRACNADVGDDAAAVSKSYSFEAHTDKGGKRRGRKEK